jgi:hypothetical protein
VLPHVTRIVMDLRVEYNQEVLEAREKAEEDKGTGQQYDIVGF